MNFGPWIHVKGKKTMQQKQRKYIQIKDFAWLTGEYLKVFEDFGVPKKVEKGPFLFVTHLHLGILQLNEQKIQ